MRKLFSLDNIMQWLALLAVSLLSYPVSVYFVTVIAKGSLTAWLVRLTVAGMISALFGYVIHFLSEKLAKKWPLKLVNVLRWILTAIPAGAAFILGLQVDVRLAVYGLVLAGVMYVIGNAVYLSGLNTKAFGAETLVFAFPAVVMFVLKYEFNTAPYIWVFVIVCLCFALHMNYQNIGFLMQRRGHSMSRLPAQLRNHNFFLIALFAVPLILLIALRGSFIGLISKVFSAFWTVFKTGFLFIFYGLLDLTDRLTSGEFEGGIGAEGGSGGKSSFDMMNELVDDSAGNAVVKTSFSIVMFSIVILFILFVTGKPLLKVIRDGIASVVRFFREKLAKFGFFRHRTDELSEDFVDVIEEVQSGSVSNALVSDSKELRRWRKGLGSYRRMPEGKEKFLAGYRLTVEGLRLYGVPIAASDTVLEVAEKGKQLLPQPAGDVAAECCSSLLFSPEVTELAMSELSEVLDKVSSLKMK